MGISPVASSAPTMRANSAGKPFTTPQPRGDKPPLNFGGEVIQRDARIPSFTNNQSPKYFLRGIELVVNDSRTGMPSGMPKGAMCVQRFDDSLNSAIHTTYRISLRSSSMREPRDPLLKVLTFFFGSLFRQME